MNNLYKIKHKSETLNLLFNRIFIKISLNRTSKNNYSLALNLVREEIQKIICIYLLLELNIIFHSLLLSSSKNIETQLLVDMIFKVVLLSTKQKISLRLFFLKQQKFIKLNSFNEWFLKDLESEDYYLFMCILQSLRSYPLKKSQFNVTESLVENFIIKLSNIMVYELFYNFKHSKVFLVEYTTDFLAVKKNFQLLKSYTYFRQVLKKIRNFSKKLNNYDYSILICTKTGFKLKSIDSNYTYSSLGINYNHTSFLDKLSILDS